MMENTSIEVISNGIVVGTPVFVPAHINKVEELVKDSCRFFVSNRYYEDGPKMVIVKGKMARRAALILADGHTVDLLVKNEYSATCNGKEIKKHCIGVVEKIVFGPPDWKVSYKEVKKGERPAEWDNPDSPDNQLWKEMLCEKLNKRYGGGDKFGYADVEKPNGWILPPEAFTNSVSDVFRPFGQ